MTTALRSDVRIAAESLCVRRTGIHFTDVDGDRVRIAIDVENRGGRRSQPAEMRIAAAPFGAFVAWQPISRVLVPSIAPNSVAQVALVARRTRVEPIPFERATPAELIERERAATRGLAALNLTVRMPSLPVDLLALTRRGSVHWIGNVDVFVRGAHVERHCGHELRIEPGKMNWTYFAVGSRADAYQFEIDAPADWTTELRELPTHRMFGDGSCCDLIAPGQWFETSGRAYVIVKMRPPANCSPAAVGIRVRERSSGNEGLVEFELSPASAGPGCFST